MRYLNKAAILILAPAVVALVFTVDAGGLRTYLKKERRELQFRAKLVTLNHDIPPFDNLLLFAKNPEGSNKEDLSQYIQYYQKVVSLFPEMGEAYHILGYCYYYSGEYERSVSSYQKAIELKPELFWDYYNLGLILFKAGQFENAVPFFVKAVSFKPKEIMNQVVTSPAFRQIMASEKFNLEMDMNLQKSYDSSYYLLAASLQAGGRTQQAREILQKIKEARPGVDFPSLESLAKLELAIF